MKAGNANWKCSHLRESVRVCGCGLVVSRESLIHYNSLPRLHVNCPDSSRVSRALISELIERLHCQGEPNNGFLAPELMEEGAICPHEVPLLPPQLSMLEAVAAQVPWAPPPIATSDWPTTATPTRCVPAGPVTSSASAWASTADPTGAFQQGPPNSSAAVMASTAGPSWAFPAGPASTVPTSTAAGASATVRRETSATAPRESVSEVSLR